MASQARNVFGAFEKRAPGLCRRVVSLDKKLYSTLSLFTQVCKWVPAIVMLGGNLAMD